MRLSQLVLADIKDQFLVFQLCRQDPRPGRAPESALIDSVVDDARVDARLQRYHFALQVLRAGYNHIGLTQEIPVRETLPATQTVGGANVAAMKRKDHLARKQTQFPQRDPV